MKNLILLGCVLTLTGCASLKDEVATPLDMDRSAGTVKMGFYYDGRGTYDDCSSAHWENATATATKICKRWGYSGAEYVEGTGVKSGYFNGYGALMQGTCSRLYQCLGNAPETVRQPE